jgi:hypothetical protein
MTKELQNQLNASSIKIENWQIKKRIQENQLQNFSEERLSFPKNNSIGIITNINGKIEKIRNGLYKFIDGL